MSMEPIQFFPNAHDVTLNQPVFSVQVHPSVGDAMELNGLVYAHGAGYKTAKQCYPGTRVGITNEIEVWARSTDPDVPTILWLNGAAGTGKSAIAHTVTLKFDQLTNLALVSVLIAPTWLNAVTKKCSVL